MRLSKAARQHRIAQILEAEPVTSQAHLVELLAGAGIEATQATVSRDLEELGALKVRAAGGEAVYAVPEMPRDRSVPSDHLRRVLGEWVVDVASSGNLVLVHTPPGSAHVVASALDRTPLPDILGTVAGDDTLVVIAAQGVAGEDVARFLRELSGL